MGERVDLNVSNDDEGDAEIDGSFENDGMVEAVGTICLGFSVLKTGVAIGSDVDDGAIEAFAELSALDSHLNKINVVNLSLLSSRHSTLVSPCGWYHGRLMLSLFREI